MGKKKLFNDPLYGLIGFQHELLYEIIDEPSFQRLRRIKQMGLSDYVYSGATHPRFQHVIGATHLFNRALDILLSKGIDITDEDRLAGSIAILCHDMGHGPFSHALEGLLVSAHHEEITRYFLHHLEKKYGHIIETANSIFDNTHEKKFLHQLISSQLDMDRLDYLSRDSYYSGVVEGVVGYDRIIQMLNVVDHQIAIEEKGLHSIEKFLIARYMMYMQVYLHKTSIIAEKMLMSIITRVNDLLSQGECVFMSDNLYKILTFKDNIDDNESFIYYFSLIDDHDVWDLVKRNATHKDFILKFLCNSLLNRKLFELSLRTEGEIGLKTTQIAEKIAQKMSITADHMKYLVFEGKEEIRCYDNLQNPIYLHTKAGALLELGVATGLKSLLDRTDAKAYVIYPKYL